MKEWRRLAGELRAHESERLRGVRPEAVLQDDEGAVWTIPEGTTAHVGRHTQAEVLLPGDRVSRKHASLRFAGDALHVENLSPRGTRLNERRLTGPAEARVGDVLRCGTRRLWLVGVLDPRRPHREAGRLCLPQRLPPAWLLLREVGRGAAGTVYEAFDEHSRQRRALKLLSAGGWAGPELVERFRREVELQRGVGDYPGIVSVFELGTLPDCGELFAVMEYVDGQPLTQRLAQLERVEGVRVLARVARAAAYAHEHGLVHRDLKPGNVMLMQDDSVRLTDFGISKALEGDDGLTASGTTLGTPDYMAPEQVGDSKHVGPPADVHALGVILYELLTGRRPFTGADVGEVLDRVSAGAFTPPCQVAPSTPPLLETLCLSAMRRDPTRRPSALELARGLEAWARGVDPPSRVSLIPPQG